MYHYALVPIEIFDEFINYLKKFLNQSFHETCKSNHNPKADEVKFPSNWKTCCMFICQG